jgi:Tfp pilus assembly protein PilN
MKAHVNLLTADLFGGDRFPFQKVALPGAFLFLVLAILIGTAVEFTRSKSLKQEIRTLNERRATITQSLGHLKSESDEILRQAMTASEGNKTREDLLKQLERERIPWSNLMREVSFLVPDSVWLTRMEGVEDPNLQKPSEKVQAIKEVKFVGFASSHMAVTQWMSALEGSRYFERVTLIFAKKDSGEGQSRWTFEIQAVLK